MSRSIGEQWHPFPARLAAALGLLRWSPANPAPEGVVYAYVWHLCHTGAQPKIREIATYAGRGKTWAGRVLKRVHADRALWLQKRPAEKTGQPRDSRGTRARSYIYNYRYREREEATIAAVLCGCRWRIATATARPILGDTGHLTSCRCFSLGL